MAPLGEREIVYAPKSRKAQEVLPEVIEIVALHEKQFGPTSMSTLGAKRLLGITYKDLGMHTKAIQTLQAIVDEFMKDEKAILRQIKLTKYQLGWALRNSGRYHEAMQTYQYLIDANTELLGRNDPNTLVCVSNYGR
eukprot:TRINITY_DN4867_c0_g1_i1.p1 TRINITY_DN4867_c0_g1~~TRINITY_DN4867_c0_g1_i1.p1  ORF type:complete len:137 (+),score=12.39 TRINITY_DN4867_c0_g1_i1:37-447(+)